MTIEQRDIWDLETTNFASPRERKLVEDWLVKKGFSFNIEFKPWEAKVYYVVYYKGEYFDAGVDDELASLSGLKETYIACVKHYYETKE